MFVSYCVDFLKDGYCAAAATDQWERVKKQSGSQNFSAAPPCVDSIVVKTPHVHRFTAFAKHCNFLKKQNKKTSIVYGKIKYFYNSV